MTIQKYGTAKWTGTLKEGKGHVSTETGVLNDQLYGFNTRFEDAKGTNPEELIAAAHASCFAMATSMVLGQSDITADSIETKAVITLEQTDGGFAVTKSALSCTITAAGDEATIREAAETAKNNCPISKLLDCDITLDLTVNAKQQAA